MDNKTKATIIVSGIIFAAGGAGLLGYWLWKKKNNNDDDNGTPAYSSFSSFKDLDPPTAATSQATVKSKCTADYGCTSYSYNATTGECVNSRGDPYKNWAETDGWFMNIKRKSTDPESSLGAWSGCPVNCGGTVNTKQTRKCTGKCPGNLERLCGQDKCMEMRREPFGTIPFPLTTIDYGSVNGLNMSQCESKCIQDPNCTGLLWANDADLGGVCMTTNSKYDYLTYASDSSPLKGVLTDTKVPSPSGTWLNFPTCSCGQPETSRTCSPASTSPCNGPNKLKCPSSSCAYDYFMGIRSSS